LEANLARGYRGVNKTPVRLRAALSMEFNAMLEAAILVLLALSKRGRTDTFSPRS
jgi:hypothetical protein